MIEPSKHGAALIEEIRVTRPDPAEIAVWWLGQSGFLIKGREVAIVIDPYLSESLTRKYAETDRPHIRMTAAPLRGEDLTEVDWVLVSHKHSDHLDPQTTPAILQASPRARLVLPASLVEHARGLGIDPRRMRPLDAGETLVVPHLSIRAVASAHELLDTDEQGRHLYLGYVFEMSGLRCYHSGDSLAYDGLAKQLGPHPFDALFLPINGRDSARGVAGNMSAAEAVVLAAQVRTRALVPHHYDMFTFNTVPVESVVEAARAARLEGYVQAARCGQRWFLKSRPTA